MKAFTRSARLVLCVLVLCCAASTALAGHTNYVIGLSPYLENNVKNEVYRRITGFLLQNVPLGSSLAVYDAYNLRTITHADVPNARAFQSDKTRANQFASQIRAVRNFLASTNAPAGEGQFDSRDAIKLPQFMDFLAEHAVRPNESLVVLLLGSPLYIDAKEPSFAMLDGYFPSDGHLNATREKTPFGVADRAGALRGVTVDLAWFADPWISPLHQEKLARFWRLFLEQQGAELGTFTGDLPTVFQSASGAAPATRPQIAALDSKDSKIEMLRVGRNVAQSDWITRETLARAETTPPSALVGPMKIGIRWRGDIDLDLYASPHADGETLYFEHTRSADGYYNKDHRSSPDHEYEFIEFERPVDVRQVQAEVNFYAGNLEAGPAGEVRIEFEGRIYSGQFQIEAAHGNKGRSGTHQRDYWARINIPQILNLEGKRQALR